MGRLHLVALRRAAAIVCLIALPVSAVLARGGSGRAVLPLWLDPILLAPPSDARSLNSTEAAVRGIAAIMAKSFGLPVPHRVTVYVYGGRRAFEQGLRVSLRSSPQSSATSRSGSARGVGCS